MIECKNISKFYSNLQVLNNVSLKIEKQEVISIVGASGAGKSTLLQIMGTLMLPSSGSVIIDGTDICKLSEKELSVFRNTKIGFVFQFHHLLPEFSALENVMMPALIANTHNTKFKTSEREIRDRAIILLDDLGLQHRIDHKPSQLSGGEQQRVAVARAIINNPSVLFADEPSGNLDSANKEDLHNLFFKLRDKYGQTIIIVTHEKELAVKCDRVLEMKDGKFIN